MSATKQSAKSKTPRWIYPLVALGAGVVLLRVAFEPFKIPSGGMHPTILVGDHLYARRVFSSTEARRGDVIIFKFPENPAQDFIKRVLGVAGDELEFIDGRPVLNGALIPQCRVGKYMYENDSRELYMESFGGRVYGVLYDAPHSDVTCKVDADCGADTACRGGACGVLVGPFKVPPGQVWVVGDNRNSSHDSRSWRGGLGAGVPFDHIKGTAGLIWMSYGAGGGVRNERLFKRVDGPVTLPPSLAPTLKPAVEKCTRELLEQAQAPAP